MLLNNFTISELPSIKLLQKSNLPNCAAIYFVSDSEGQVIYVGRTVNLVERWREHHRYNQLKRLNRKTPITISWMTCSNDIKTLIELENKFIKLYKPPLNWSKVVSPVKRITPSEVALQQSLQQLAKFNSMIFGFDPIATEEPPTIYLVYPVYGKRGISGRIRSALKNINKKASSLKWKEYNTESKSLGKFGYWKTEYNGIRIDLTPFNYLVNFMSDSNRRTIAGVEFMAFSSIQIEAILANAPEIKQKSAGLDALADDPIPIEFANQNQLTNLNQKNTNEKELWEELEPMSEGEARVITRQFLDVNGVEIEVCINENSKYFVRHNVYWWIIHGSKNPDPYYNCVTKNLEDAANRLPTIKWSGYKFRFETIVFSEDDVEVESILLPLGMFEDLIRDTSGWSEQFREEVKSGQYQLQPNDNARIKLCVWLQSKSLSSLLQTNNS
jgi:predicted GIY-YIG superfamily endonuclease